MPWDPYRNFFLEIAPGHLTSKFYTMLHTRPGKVMVSTVVLLDGLLSKMLKNCLKIAQNGQIGPKTC